jgi:hypothetical protein
MLEATEAFCMTTNKNTCCMQNEANKKDLLNKEKVEAE